MLAITFIEHDGTEHPVQAEAGLSLMEVARANDIPGIEAECGGACACATCHVIIDVAWLSITGPASGIELELLECAEDPGEGSRLSCQIDLTSQLDGLVVRLPPMQS